MGTQKIGLGPLNKIKTYLDHFRQEKYFFYQKAKFFKDFFEDSKNCFFHNFMYDYNFIYPLCVLWDPSYPLGVVNKKSAQIWGCWWLILCQNVNFS